MRFWRLGALPSRTTVAKTTTTSPTRISASIQKAPTSDDIKTAVMSAAIDTVKTTATTPMVRPETTQLSTSKLQPVTYSESAPQLTPVVTTTAPIKSVSNLRTSISLPDSTPDPTFTPTPAPTSPFTPTSTSTSTPSPIDTSKVSVAIDKDTGETIDLRTTQPVSMIPKMSPSLQKPIVEDGVTKESDMDFRRPYTRSTDFTPAPVEDSGVLPGYTPGIDPGLLKTGTTEFTTKQSNVVVDKDTGKAFDLNTLSFAKLNTSPTIDPSRFVMDKDSGVMFDQSTGQPAGAGYPEITCPSGCWADWLTNSCVCPGAEANEIYAQAAQAVEKSGWPWWLWALILGGAGYAGYKWYTGRQVSPTAATVPRSRNPLAAYGLAGLWEIYGPIARKSFTEVLKHPGQDHIDIALKINEEPWEVQTTLEDLEREGVVYQAGGKWYKI